jgi:hypothetical protein
VVAVKNCLILIGRITTDEYKNGKIALNPFDSHGYLMGDDDGKSACRRRKA